ncbi:uncharacterized protein LOC127081056 [Lathyrus oleraceus]|uniref:uncharacterized protein LOC127081056 n=1 Tax=Pisum sativum TaxID=3888 RepID=UPI0021D25A01|nr:uncharacterized protein LOC127081056 [Pisum sativum]
MASYIDNDDLLIHCFQDSLYGASLDWYMSFEHPRIRSWRDLSEAFLKQYKYNLDMAPARLQLQNQAQKPNETFKEYAHHWREMASRVRPTLSDNELFDIFMGRVQGLYCEKMIENSSSNFADMVTIGEGVENGLKSGKITDTTTLQATNRNSHRGFVKKKEGETNAVTISVHPQYQFPVGPMSYYPYSYVVAAQYQQLSCQYQPQKVINNQHLLRKIRINNTTVTIKRQGRGHNNKNNFGNCPQIDNIRVSYAELVPYLIHVGDIVLKEIPAAYPPFRPKHDPNALCAFHVGYIGHSTEDCWGLKYKVQDLINQDILSFSEEKRNVKMNPLPNHGGSIVNVVIEEEGAESVLRADDVKTPLSVVLKRLE